MAPRWAYPRSTVTLVVDGRGRITSWSAAAERRFGYRADEAVGQPCYQLLDCRDAQGRGVGAQCPLLHCVRAGCHAPPVKGFVRHRDGTLERVLRSAHTPAPGSGEGAVLYFATCPESLLVMSPDERGQEWVDLRASLQKVVDEIGADAAEFFLALPHQRQLVLVTHEGESNRAFQERLQFEFGEGFPGLAAMTGEPVVSLDLPGDERYLRAEVKRQGYRCYLCLPALGEQGMIGILGLAARRKAVDLVVQLPFLEDVARSLGKALEKDLARFRGHLWSASEVQDSWLAVKELTNQLAHELAAASAITLMASAHGDEPELQPAAALGMGDQLNVAGGWAACPAFAREVPMVVWSRKQCPSAGCRCAHACSAVRLCAPLLWAGRRVGVLSLGYARRSPWPGEHLPRLIQGAQLLAEVVKDLQTAGDPGTAPRPVDGEVRSTVAKDREHLHETRPALRISALGGFAVWRDGVLVPAKQFGRRRALLVFKILLCRYGGFVHRDELIEWLWPSTPPARAVALLQVAIHYLRRTLEPNLEAPGQSHFILGDGITYQFNVDSPHWFDVHEFRTLAKQARLLESQGRYDQARRLARTAAGLYMGPFLADEPYSDWCMAEREQLRSIYIEVLCQLGRLAGLLQDHKEAIDAYRRALEVDPLLEDVHRALIETLWRAGCRAEAIRQFHVCRAILHQELGVDPSEETQTLYAELMSGHLSL